MTDRMKPGPRLGIDRHVDVAIRLRSTRSAAAATARAVGAILEEHPTVSARLAGIASHGEQVDLTLVVTLGSVEQVAHSRDEARESLAVLHRLIVDLAPHQPSFATIPDPKSAEARAARRLLDEVDAEPSLRVEVGS